MMDNGGEFSSDEICEVMSILNVKVITTTAEFSRMSCARECMQLLTGCC